MAELSVFQLYDEFRSNYEADPDFTISFHEKNSIFFNNYPAFKDEDELLMYTEMCSMFIGSLCTKGRFNVAIDEADKSLKIFDEAIARLNPANVKSQYQLYNDLIFLKAMASYRIHDYGKSRMLFKSLTETDPENENFKMWLANATYHTRANLLAVINIICAAMVFSEIIFKSSLQPSLRIILPAIGVTGLLSVMLYQYSLKTKLKRSEKSKNTSDK